MPHLFNDPLSGPPWPFWSFWPPPFLATNRFFLVVSSTILLGFDLSKRPLAACFTTSHLSEVPTASPRHACPDALHEWDATSAAQLFHVGLTVRLSLTDTTSIQSRVKLLVSSDSLTGTFVF